MQTLRSYIIEGISKETKEITELLVDSIYSKYVKNFDKNNVACVGWMDGTENSELRFQKIYEAGINNNDSILDVGCGVGHLHRYLKTQGWSGKYLGFDPNKQAIDLI